MSEEDELFRAAIGEVRRIETNLADVRPPPPPPIPRQHEADLIQARLDMANGCYDGAELETGEELNYARPGVDRNTLRRLRGGKFSIQGELDLHGMTVDRARSAVARFLAEAMVRDVRCVRIIHGKGYRSPEGAPVIKRKLDGWLRRHGNVLAYCAARPVDGGTGAAYVLLTRD
jgi:DNA-nicking Smr family endonuclease